MSFITKVSLKKSEKDLRFDLKQSDQFMIFAHFLIARSHLSETDRWHPDGHGYLGLYCHKKYGSVSLFKTLPTKTVFGTKRSAAANISCDSIRI